MILHVSELISAVCTSAQGFLSIADSSIDAPPPLKPAKKYADMSGFTVSEVTHTSV